MNADILDYLLWRGDISLNDKMFNEVDGAILARLSYLPFEHIVLNPSEPVRLAYAAAEMLALPNIESTVLQKEDVDFLREISKSERFCNSYIFEFTARSDFETQTQFSAVSVELESGDICVSFRGTDSTVTGWREDFNMGFVCPVPAQTSAVKYLEKIAADRVGDLIIVGHSKGGNLAVYASAFCGEDIQKRIKKVYNFDGPGFVDSVLEYDGYKTISEKVSTYVPQFSVVGMLLGHKEKYTIVHSERVGIMQHDIYSWNVRRDGFVYLETVNDGSKFLDYTLKNWLANMNYEQREKFVDAIFAAISERGSDTLKDLNVNRLSNIKSALKSVKNLDDTTIMAVTRALILLVKSAGSGLNQIMQNKQHSEL